MAAAISQYVKQRALMIWRCFVLGNQIICYIRFTQKTSCTILRANFSSPQIFRPSL